jgi:hypothetical protein
VTAELQANHQGRGRVAQPAQLLNEGAPQVTVLAWQLKSLQEQSASSAGVRPRATATRQRWLNELALEFGTELQAAAADAYIALGGRGVAHRVDAR